MGRRIDTGRQVWVGAKEELRPLSNDWNRTLLAGCVPPQLLEPSEDDKHALLRFM